MFTGRLSAELKAYIAYLARDKNYTVKDICKKTGVSRATVYRLKKHKVWDGRPTKTRHNKGGRPSKLTARDKRKLLRTLLRLRKEEGQFSSQRIMTTAGLSCKMSDRTVRRCLNRHGYYCLQARKKGLLFESDCKKRLRFAKDMKKNFPSSVWTDSIAFYLDGVSFAYKRKPKDQALARRGRVWRKKCEGLKRGCTAKGKKEGSGGKLVKLIVATTYDKGVIKIEEYQHLDGEVFADFVNRNFRDMFHKAGKGRSTLFLQDNAPNQNSARVRGALRRVRAKQLNFPPRSGDLNPIENLFHRVKAIISQQAIKENIEYETFDEFRGRVSRHCRTFQLASTRRFVQ